MGQFDPVLASGICNLSCLCLIGPDDQAICKSMIQVAEYCIQFQQGKPEHVDEMQLTSAA